MEGAFVPTSLPIPPFPLHTHVRPGATHCKCLDICNISTCVDIRSRIHSAMCNERSYGSNHDNAQLESKPFLLEPEPLPLLPSALLSNDFSGVIAITAMRRTGLVMLDAGM